MALIAEVQKIQSYLKRRNVFLFIYYLSLAAILIGFIYSRALLSIGQISMITIWFFEGDLSLKLRRFRENKFALLFTGLYFIHVVWLLNTSDFVYAAEDLRIKLPLLLIPLVFSTTELFTTRVFRFTIFLFIAVIFSATIVIFINYLLKRKEIVDIREASFLISHIRLALMICLSLACCIYFSVRETLLVRAGLISLSVWFTFYMIYFAYLTGVYILAALLLLMLILYLRRSQLKSSVKAVVVFILLAGLAILGATVFNVAEDYFYSKAGNDNEDKLLTESNRPYTQWYKAFGYTIKENDHLVFQNINFEELEREWNKRSKLKVTYLDDDHSELEDIILRFLSSKGLSKDSAAVVSLTDQEVEEIENGITNVNYMGKSRLYRRIYNMLWEYDVYREGGNINGHSLGIRLEFMKTGINIFKRHFFFGTGTGDIEWTFQEQYVMDESNLQKEWRFRSHNQLISVAATFGIFGLLYFITVLVAPVVAQRKNFLYLCFALIFFISILTEDTLETQIGVTFYAFFNSLLFFTNLTETTTPARP